MKNKWMNNLKSSLRALSKSYEQEESKKHTSFDSLGRNISNSDHYKGNLNISADKSKILETEYYPKMQPRKIRFLNIMYLSGFILWNIFVISFIMYRVNGNDLDDLEREVNENSMLPDIVRKVEKERIFKE